MCLSTAGHPPTRMVVDDDRGSLHAVLIAFPPPHPLFPDPHNVSGTPKAYLVLLLIYVQPALLHHPVLRHSQILQLPIIQKHTSRLSVQGFVGPPNRKSMTIYIALSLFTIPIGTCSNIIYKGISKSSSSTLQNQRNILTRNIFHGSDPSRHHPRTRLNPHELLTCRRPP